MVDLPFNSRVCKAQLIYRFKKKTKPKNIMTAYLQIQDVIADFSWPDSLRVYVGGDW